MLMTEVIGPVTQPARPSGNQQNHQEQEADDRVSDAEPAADMVVTPSLGSIAHWGRRIRRDGCVQLLHYRASTATGAFTNASVSRRICATNLGVAASQ